MSLIVPGWECGMCSKGNPVYRNRCKKCGRKQVGGEKVVQVEVQTKNKRKKQPTRKGVK